MWGVWGGGVFHLHVVIAFHFKTDLCTGENWLIKARMVHSDRIWIKYFEYSLMASKISIISVQNAIYYLCTFITYFSNAINFPLYDD